MSRKQNGVVFQNKSLPRVIIIVIKYLKSTRHTIYNFCFFCAYFRASQKLNLNGSPHRRKRRGSQGEDAMTTPHGFASGLHKHAPLLPALLQRRIAGKELTGVGKV